MRKISLTVFLVICLAGVANAQSTLALQEKCAEGAKKIVSETGGCCGMDSTKDYTMYCQYISHYNKKLDKCFIRFGLG